MNESSTTQHDTIRLGRSSWWTQLPDDLAFHPDLTLAALRCYAYLQGEAARAVEVVGKTQDEIAEATGLAARSVARPLKWLEETGWITRDVVRFGTVSLRTDYIVHVDSPRADLARMDHAEKRGDDRAAERAVPNPQISIGIEEPDDTTRAASARVGRAALTIGDGFDEWWKLYPRKVAKPAALRAWCKAVTRCDGIEFLLGDMAGRVGRWETWPKGDQQYIPHPATFLNRDEWNDELPQERSRRQPGAVAKSKVVPGEIDQGAL